MGHGWQPETAPDGCVTGTVGFRTLSHSADESDSVGGKSAGREREPTTGLDKHLASGVQRRGGLLLPAAAPTLLLT